MPDITALPSGETVPVLGQGTWAMGESARSRAQEALALRLGIELGMTLIDTAEMYASGGAEEVVADAISGLREKLFIVSKVLPNNASRRGTVQACERSLRRMKTDRIDLYLLHWRGGHPLRETIEAFEELKRAQKIRHWGVSNFDTDDMKELADLPAGSAAASNQVLYNLTRRGVEYDLLPYCRKLKIPVMAYSPIEQGRMLGHAALREIAARHQATPAQIALAWLIRQDGMIVIPKASSELHVRENAAARDLKLTQQDLAALDQAFPAPKKARPLEML
jgi:diketogulonate reductase-like aldo/keto reductase